MTVGTARPNGCRQHGQVSEQQTLQFRYRRLAFYEAETGTEATKENTVTESSDWPDGDD